MKLGPQFCGGVLALVLASSAFGQGTFQNLDFELINPSVIHSQPPNFVPFAAALPDWTGYYGTNLAPQAIINGVSLGGVLITVVTPFGSVSNAVIDGIATVNLAGGITSSLAPQASAAIAQTGLIPPGTWSLRFSVGSPSDVGYLNVSLNGQNIPIFPLQAGSNFQIYGADISASAGTTAELRFMEQPANSPNHSPPTFAYLDDVQFSILPVPEPGTLCLLGLGGMFLGWWLSRRASP